jgi:hypothetical protein
MKSRNAAQGKGVRRRVSNGAVRDGQLTGTAAVSQGRPERTEGRSTEYRSRDGNGAFDRSGCRLTDCEDQR